MAKTTIPRKLEPFYRKHKRIKLAFGGRGGAKSQTYAEGFLQLCSKGAWIGCFREYQNSIDDSCLALMESLITSKNLKGFKIKNNQVVHKSGGLVKFKGIARSIGAVQSIHGINFAWIEEAQFLSEKSIRIFIPSIRAKNAEIWMSMNMMSSTDPVCERFINPFLDEINVNKYYEDDYHIITWLNYYDNPFFPKVLNEDRKVDELIMSPAMYKHVWLGYPNDSVDFAIIQPDWFDAAIDAHEKLGWKPKGRRVLSYDPSDGGDKQGIVIRTGQFIEEAEFSPNVLVNLSCDHVLDRTLQEQVDLFVWDRAGMGTALLKQVEDSLGDTKIDYVGFNGANKVDKPGEYYQFPGKKKKGLTNKKTFLNRRAQRYIGVRDRLYNTYRAVVGKEYIDPDKMLSISSKCKDLRSLRSELCKIPTKPRGDGLIQILTKQEMGDKLSIKSPALADCVMMSEEGVQAKIGPKSNMDLEFTSYY